MDQTAHRLFPSYRLSVGGVLFLTTMLHYALRLALNMSIVCMVIPTYSNTSSVSSNTSAEAIYGNTSSSCVALQSSKDYGYEGEFHWSRKEVGYILAAFFYGYIPSQLIGGWLADRYGVRHVLGCGMLIGGLLSLLTPSAARLHPGLLIALRACMGLTMGVTFPSTHNTIGRWIPPTERATFVGLIYGGTQAGVVLTFVISSLLCSISWGIIFYIGGAITVLWYALWLYSVYSSPELHPRITDHEKMYILNALKRTEAKKKKVPIPWRSIITSQSVLGLCVAHFTNVWTAYVIAIAVPLYMQDVLQFNIKQNGILSSLPALVVVISGAPIAALSDVLLNSVIKSRWWSRKIMQTICGCGMAACMIAIGYLHCDQRYTAVTLLCLAQFFNVFSRGGSACSPADIAPRFAGSTYGLTNSAGNFAGFLLPLAVGNLTPNGTQEEWQWIFFIDAGLLIVGWLVYVVFVSAEEQDWAKDKTTTVDVVEIEKSEGEEIMLKSNKDLDKQKSVGEWERK